MQINVPPLASEVAEAIAGSPHIDGETVSYEYHDGHVVLRGTVGTYFQKQMAQEAVRQLRGVSRIENELQVSW